MNFLQTGVYCIIYRQFPTGISSATCKSIIVKCICGAGNLELDHHTMSNKNVIKSNQEYIFYSVSRALPLVVYTLIYEIYSDTNKLVSIYFNAPLQSIVLTEIKYHCNPTLSEYPFRRCRARLSLEYPLKFNVTVLCLAKNTAYDMRTKCFLFVDVIYLKVHFI